jgi:uncharacterized membrane-anchored protein YhcB (DUF1043 family)
VHSTIEVWIIAAAALAVGAVLGYFVYQYLHPVPRRNRELEQQLHALQEQNKHHRYDVNAHFNKTSELLGQLANSYREVHNHLARGAVELCDPGSVKILRPLPDQSAVLEEQTPTIIEPPRDYALKTPYDKGVLDEDFGLEKNPHARQLSEPPRLI